ncbi:nuclear transport factor 2 family protein [Gloeocapsa sp. PCC 73106]|uniref:YybH family protein n=1 Tax=Gloeocapsa sp. PCC 73106 TaxID=102232 RepID=UPI0002ABB2EB|nr:nuclear transport factor 2 family protein [Gloeocapsa sp. PCC 73106]ELR97134.1 hypothetical protein GLO73106DRAFT_00009390 [Gloeocapsa sp. PCC 73106]
MVQLETFKKYLILLCLSSAVSIFSAHLVQAQAEPPELRETLESMEMAANEQDLDKIMEFYSPEFANSDGLRYESIATALEQLWQNYPRLNYEIQLDSWSQEGDTVVAETTTKIQGTRLAEGEIQKLNSTIRSRQYFQGQQLISQEIISEETDITSGNPPEIEVSVPSQAKTREQFNFDVIVQNPLENGILLGGAIEEQTRSDRYLKPSNFELTPLASGGVFKIVTAPGLPGSYWLSAIIIQGDGKVTVTRRVTVEPNE